MSVILDSSAIIALAVGDNVREQVVSKALETEICYMTPTAAIECYATILQYVGRQLAEHWLDFIALSGTIRLEAESGREYVELAGEARSAAPITIGSASSAALAQLRKVSVLTAASGFRELERAGFCEVSWI